MILWHDLAAAGVNILAASSPLYPISTSKRDKRAVQYNISDTSMAHASAAAAYVKSFHPNMSLAMIKSALMTTGKVCSASLPYFSI